MRGGSISRVNFLIAPFRRLKCLNSIIVSVGATSPFVLVPPFSLMSSFKFGPEAEAADGLEGEAMDKLADCCLKLIRYDLD